MHWLVLYFYLIQVSSTAANTSSFDHKMCERCEPGTPSTVWLGAFLCVKLWSFRRYFLKNFKPQILCIEKCVIVLRAETAFLSQGCPPQLMHAHEQLWRYKRWLCLPQIPTLHGQ